MLDAPPRSHWLLAIGGCDDPADTDAPLLDGHTTVANAWPTVASRCGMTQDQLAERVADHFRLSLADLGTAQVHASALVPEKLARERLVYPLRETDRELVVATADPTDLEAERLLGFASGWAVTLEIAPPSALQEALDARYAPDRAVERLLKSRKPATSRWWFSTWRCRG